MTLSTQMRSLLTWVLGLSVFAILTLVYVPPSLSSGKSSPSISSERTLSSVPLMASAPSSSSDRRILPVWRVSRTHAFSGGGGPGDHCERLADTRLSRSKILPSVVPGCAYVGSAYAGSSATTLGPFFIARPELYATRGGQKLLGPIIQPRTLAEAVGNQGQALVNQVLKGRGALGNLTTAERTEAAKFFRDVATRTKGANAEAAAQFNRLRADFLEGKTSEVPGYINDFIQRHGL